MKSSEAKKAYHQKYVEKHRQKIKEYNRRWMFNWRHKQKPKMGSYKLHRTETMKSKKGHCLYCDILLSSKLAGKHNGKYCQDCLVSF